MQRGDLAGASALTRRRGGGLVALSGVALAYLAAVVLTGAVRIPLDLDEAVYASQFARDVPGVPYTAHRSVGEGLLVAPLTALTSSVTALRWYMAVLAAVLLFLAYLPWTRVLDDRAVVPVAAGLFALTWVSIRYGVTVLPNFAVAVGAVAAVGLLVRRSWFGVFAVMAGLALLRPTDATWIAAPLFVAGLVLFPWKRPVVPAAVAGGLAVGWTAWLVESFARFGGPLPRLAAVDGINQTGLHFLLARHLASLHGRESCPPTTLDCGPITAGPALWWLGGTALVLVGLYTTRPAPSRARRALMVCTATALTFGASYIFLTPWAVPRYLLPAYALLSLPAAAGLVPLLRTGPPRDHSTTHQVPTTPRLITTLRARLSRDHSTARQVLAAPATPRLTSVLHAGALRDPSTARRVLATPAASKLISVLRTGLSRDRGTTLRVRPMPTASKLTSVLRTRLPRDHSTARRVLAKPVTPRLITILRARLSREHGTTHRVLATPTPSRLTAVLRAGVSRSRGTARRVLAVAVALVVLTHLVLQLTSARRVAASSRQAISWPVQAADTLGERGVDGDCVVLGRFAPQVAYLRRCRAADMPDGISTGGEITPANVARLREAGLRVILITTRRPTLPDIATWTRVPTPKGPQIHLSPPSQAPSP